MSTTSLTMSPMAMGSTSSLPPPANVPDFAALDKECSALGGLFQQVINDMKVRRRNPPLKRRKLGFIWAKKFGICSEWPKKKEMASQTAPEVKKLFDRAEFRERSTWLMSAIGAKAFLYLLKRAQKVISIIPVPQRN